MPLLPYSSVPSRCVNHGLRAPPARQMQRSPTTRLVPDKGSRLPRRRIVQSQVWEILHASSRKIEPVKILKITRQIVLVTRAWQKIYDAKEAVWRVSTWNVTTAPDPDHFQDCDKRPSAWYGETMSVSTLWASSREPETGCKQIM